MGRKARKKLSAELEGISAEERARRGRAGGQLEDVAGSYLRGENNPEIEGARTYWASAMDEAANRAARTRNRAGYGAQQDEMARQEARTVADAIRRGRLVGVDILGQLFGSSGNVMSNLYGQRAQLASQPGFWDSLLQHFVSNAGSAAGAAAGG